MHFLGLSLSLADGTIYDNLQRDLYAGLKSGIFCLLCGYANAKETVETGELVSYEKLHGGRAFSRTFRSTVVNPFARIFGRDCSLLRRVSGFFDGEELEHGDCSIRIFALPLVPITIILWTKSSEFPAAASVLFDSSINYYISTEEASILGDLTLARMRDAARILQNSKTEF
ncbi:MAG: DUF3786 domain-containing protein [Candidatus Hodarchaeota archaeon]